MKLQSLFTIRTIDRVLFVDATGPFNEAVINRYQRELIASVEALSPEPWGMILTLHNESLFTPETEAELIKVIQWRMAFGMTKVGLLTTHIASSDEVKAQMTRMYVAAGVVHAFFDDSNDALDWLKD